MKVRVLAFAALAQRLGWRSRDVVLSDKACVSDALRALNENSTQHENMRGVAYAVNGEYVDLDFVLHEGDELALIPPVSGG